MSELPEGWIKTTLDALNVFSSKTIDPSSFPDETFELYSVPVFPTGKPEIVNGDSIGSSKQKVIENDVLLCKINPRINRVWQVEKQAKWRQIASSEWIVVRCKELNTEYLRLYFSSPDFRALMCADVTGVGGSLTRAQPKNVSTYPILLPPLNEQKRIADKLETLLARATSILEKLNRVEGVLKRFRHAVLAAATSGKLTEDLGNSKWRTSTLGELLTDMRYGTAKKSNYQDTDGTPVLRIPNVANGKIDTADLKYAHFDARELETLLLEAGDILVIRSNGSVDLVGRAAIVSPEVQGYAFAGYLIRLRVNQAILSPDFLCLVLANPKTRDYIEFTARSTSGVNNINSEELREIEITFPSLPEQLEIVSQVETLFGFADQLEARIRTARAQLERLTPAILAKAFRGELVPQDPNDEPASVLVERIRAVREVQAGKKERGIRQTRKIRQASGYAKGRSAASAEVEAITKTSNQVLLSDTRGQSMKRLEDVPKDHLTQTIKTRNQTPLVLEAKTLWQASEMSIDDFYVQLGREVKNGLLRINSDQASLVEVA